MSGIVIIGNGIAGITCARHVRKMSDTPITIISAETKHFYSRTALMYVYMGHMKYEHLKPYEDWFWEKNKLMLMEDQVTQVDTKSKEVVVKNGNRIGYDKLIVACGSKSNIPDLSGVQLRGVQALYGMPDVAKMEENTRNIRKAVIAGGGLIGIEMAEMLLSRNIQVTMLVRETLYWGSVLPHEEAAMIGAHIKEHHIDLQLEQEIDGITGDENGKVRSVKTKKGGVIESEFVGLTVGVSPNISFLKESGIETDKGVLVNKFFETNVTDIYAIGDCAQQKEPLPGRKPVEQVWYTGKIQGETLAQTLCGKRTAYQPGVWFNSAKFLDIEYQTYGDVPATLPDHQETFFWQHHNQHIFFRVVFDKNEKTITGVNALGMRLRHELLNDWLQQKVSVDYAMEHLARANFDPEFYRKHEAAILEKYNAEFGKNIGTKRKGWQKLFSVK